MMKREGHRKGGVPRKSEDQKGKKLEKLTLSEAIAISTMYPPKPISRQSSKTKKKSWIRVPDLTLEGCIVKSAQIDIRVKLGRRTTGGGNAIQRALSNASSHYYETTATLQTPWALTQAHKARNFALTAMRYCTSWRDDPSPRSNDDCVSFLRALILDVRAARNALFEHDPMVFPNARASLAILEPSLPPGIIVQFSAQGTDLIVSAFSLAPCKATLGDDAIEVDDLYPLLRETAAIQTAHYFLLATSTRSGTSIRQAHTFVVGKLLAYLTEAASRW